MLIYVYVNRKPQHHNKARLIRVLVTEAGYADGSRQCRRGCAPHFATTEVIYRPKSSNDLQQLTSQKSTFNKLGSKGKMRKKHDKRITI